MLTPDIRYVEGDEYPWKGYAVGGEKDELIIECAETIISQLQQDKNSISKVEHFTEEETVEFLEAVEKFYSDPYFKHLTEPTSGKDRALREVMDYCDVVNSHS